MLLIIKRKLWLLRKFEIMLLLLYFIIKVNSAIQVEKKTTKKSFKLMARCPECAGSMTFNPDLKMMVCNSCGLTLERQELDTAWKSIRNENIEEDDELQRKKSKKKEWLDWYGKSRAEKND